MAKNVKLFIQKDNPNDPKYKEVWASNNVKYYYRFNGGNSIKNGSNENKGSNTFKTQDKIETFTITFGGTVGNTYKFTTSSFVNKNTSPDLTSANTDSKVVVLDICSKKGTWNYGVTVQVRPSGPTLVCDPVIKNTW